MNSFSHNNIVFNAKQTTLMDVIALRKGSALSFRGNVGITGDVLLNGFPQEKISFKRCSGYVEQFDIQTAELTISESIRFSSQLRLDRTNPVHDSPDGLERHIDQIIETLGLTREADFLVGSDEASGLTFEQKKRLSIAVELAASPSLVFLDEPTSGKFWAGFGFWHASSTLFLLSFTNYWLMVSILHFRPPYRIGCEGCFAGGKCTEEDGRSRADDSGYNSPAFFYRIRHV